MSNQTILHVGTEKTGTTSIQRFLADHQKELLECGVLYPLSLGPGPHLGLTTCCIDYKQNSSIIRAQHITSETEHKEFANNIVRNLCNEVSASNPRMIILSDEHINVHLYTVEMLGRLRNIIEEFSSSIKVVIYFRRQDRLLESMLSEAIKNKVFNIYDFGDPVGSIPDLRYRFNYLAILKNLQSVFFDSEITVRAYDEGPNFDVVGDFNSLLDVGIKKRSNIRTFRENRSISRRVFLSLAQLGTKATNLNEETVLRQWRNIINLANQNFPAEGYRLNKESAQRFLCRFEDMNSTIIKSHPNMQNTLCPRYNSITYRKTDEPVKIEELCGVILDELDLDTSLSINRILENI